MSIFLPKLLPWSTVLIVDCDSFPIPTHWYVVPQSIKFMVFRHSIASGYSVMTLLWHIRLRTSDARTLIVTGEVYSKTYLTLNNHRKDTNLSLSNSFLTGAPQGLKRRQGPSAIGNYYFATQYWAGPCWIPKIWWGPAPCNPCGDSAYLNFNTFVPTKLYWRGTLVHQLRWLPPFEGGCKRGAKLHIYDLGWNICVS